MTIRNEGNFYAACSEIPFVSAADIAFHALIDTKPHDTDYKILGPELLTYDEVYGSLLREISQTLTESM